MSAELSQGMQEMAAERGIVSQDFDDAFLDSVRTRILAHRAAGDFDWANVWSNYLSALESGRLHMYIFDELDHPVPSRREAAQKLLACVGGWTDAGMPLVEIEP